ncbi:MAG TPA: Ig-like domain-containing protein [Saprospiraceae bacterium]|nr:Ig-like domain-containing protein [Saprospiraceae bacterium]
MRSQYHIPKVQMEKMMAFVILLLMTPLFIKIQAQSLKITATGTGQTTGHIANLSITNTTGSTVRINPQTCYIPSDGKYQPYVATIPGTSVPPGTSFLPVQGYCANVYAHPVPDGNPMPLVSDWIPVIQPAINIPRGGTNILTTPAVPAFKPEDVAGLIQSPGYAALPAKASTNITTTWPNTNILFEGTIKPGSHPKTFAPVLVEAVNSITKGFDDLRQAGIINTAFSGDPEKEREAIIQQSFWMYTARITGKEYQKEQFREKVFSQFEDNSGTEVESLSAEEKEKLKSGIDVFWNTFINVSIEAKLLNGSKNAAGPTSNASTIMPPWDKIQLTDSRMKPGNDYMSAGQNNFPWIPVIAGAVGAGTLVYLLSDGEEKKDSIDCTFTASATPTNTTCGQSNGSITLNVSPPGSYSYLWSNGAVTQALNNIPPGNYSVTVTIVGTTCTQVVQTTVTNQNQSFNATISAQNTDCDQPNGSVTVTPTPPGAYTYLWSNGATTQNQTNLPAGNYTVTISAGGTCERILSAQIGTKPFQPSVSFTTTPSTCGGSDGAATIVVNPPDQYTYAWSNGQSGSGISGVEAGSYSVTVSKPGTPCTYVANVVVPDIPATFSVTISSTMSGCGLSNGTANATVDLPGTYNFIWSNGQTGPQASGLAEGLYTVTVTIPGTSCSEEASVTITETPASFVVSLTSTPAGCGLSDGTATATVNPPGAYNYMWSNGQSGFQISNLAPGNYTVTVTLQGEDCTQQGSIAVQSTPFPATISTTTTPSSCGGSDGTASATVTPPGEYNYQWSNGQTNSQLSGVSAGTYTVTVTIPGTNCSKEATATVGETPATFTVSVTTTPSGCGLNNGTATATVNPPGNYDYTWSNGQTGSQISGVPAGSYTVTVSIAGTSCSKVVTTTVDQLPPSFTLSFNSTPSGCGLNNGSAVVNVNPPGTYTYLWSNGATGMQITNVGPGVYTVTVTIIGTSCSTSGSVTVGQTGGGGFTASFATVNADCGVANGSATITVSPPGEYTYLWSNQQTGNKLQGVGPGTYSVTVTDAGACSEVFSVSIGEDIAEYINILNTTPATCIGGGNIRFTATTPGAGPLVIEVVGPGGTVMFTVGSGVYDLSSFMTVLPGMYTITVTDQSIGPICSETVSATISDVTPPTELLDDFYFTEGTQPLNENALENDEGFNIQMTQVDNEDGGTVSFMPNGNFTFIADLGFSGEASFVYTVTDACGNTSTAIVTIVVDEVPCDIDVDYETTPASCGLEDGSITVIVSGPGEYEYEWSNGDSGPTIQNVPPGGYIVTITDLEIGCTFEGTIILEGLPADYIEDIVLIQPTCEGDGDIQFTALSPSGNSLVMLVEHPFGGGDFEIEPGLIQLSDYVTTVPGEYFVEVSDPEAGPGCSESFTVTLNQPPLPEIEVVEIFPPSSPGAMDGSAFVEVITPGQQPYAVYVDGMFSFIVNQSNFFLLGLGVGVHTVHLVDIQGCPSNTVQFFVPAPTEAFSFGVSITDAGTYSTSNEQPSIYHPGNNWRSVLSGSYRFDVGNIQQVVRVLYAPRLRMNIGESANGFVAMEYLSGPQDVKWKGIGLRAQAGLGTYVELHDPVVDQTAVPYYWLIRASAERTVFKRILLTGSVSARGLDFIAPISYEFGFRMPFYTWNKSGSL